MVGIFLSKIRLHIWGYILIKEYLFVEKYDMRSDELFIVEGTNPEEAYRKAAEFFLEKTMFSWKTYHAVP